MLNRFASGVLMLTAALFIAGCGGASDTSAVAPSPEAARPPEQPGEPEVSEPEPPEQPRESVPAQAEPESTGAPETSLTVPADAVTLLQLPWEEIEEHIANNLQGKVVVVDLWATYCVPCRESFPGLVALSRQDPDNIVCMSVSLDDPEDEDKRTEVVQFLEEQQATFTNFLCTTDTEQLYDEILKIGGIPAVFVYGRDGELAKVFNGPTPEGTDHTYEEHIAPFVTELAASE